MQKPDTELSGELERCKGIGEGADPFMYRPVSNLAESVKHICRFLWNDPLVGKAAQCLFKGFPFAKVDCMTGSYLLGKQFCKLTKLENACGWVFTEIALRQRS